ncbi:MAG: hypothetical protein O3B45_02975 [Bacteroidetes bacterium]|nr:hypothetical protein [Bacteroidota bacterium]
MTDLINLGQLDSPYVQTNERLSQSFETKEWVYRKQFARPAQGDSPEMSYELVFDGIDTYATILLNGDTLGETSNAHRAYRLPASHLIDGLNTLEVWLHSAVIQGQRKLDASPWLIPVSNEDRPQGKQTSSVSRKALYQYGWDWGPRLVSAGVWKSISLQRVQISGPQNMRLDLQQLDATQATYLVHLNASAPLDWQLDGPEGAPTQHQLEQIHDSLWQLTIISPKRWWPRDMGDQPLYTLHCINDVGSQSLRFGIRSIEWVRARDDIGRSFACHVNGQKIFARGANIIPADFFPVRARERIEETLQQAVAANMNMVRVWGGAVYGEDAFYDRCDELGLLVWQDFMFACCMVPGDSAYAASVEAEARYNVKRLRHHPSLAIWCGNNESEKAWKSWGWPNLFGLSTQDSIEVQQAYDQIFGALLPQIVAEESGQFYWASSPMKDPLHELGDGLSGDEHAWRVWFDTLDFDYYSNHEGRFASEYGLQSLPNRHTLEAVGIHAFDDEALQFRQRSKMEWLQPGLDGWGMMRIYAKRYAADPKIESDHTDALDRWIYLTQLTQAEGLREALERHRFSRGKTSGSLYWQLNDVWPTVSWSTVDHAGRWKLAHHAVSHANQPQRVLIDRTDLDSLRTAWINSSNQHIQGVVTLECIDWSGTIVHSAQITCDAPPFSEQEKNWGALPTWITRSDRQALRWKWESVDGRIIDHGVLRFAKPSELQLPEARVSFEKEGRGLTLTTDSVAYGVQLTSSVPGRFSSNGMTLVPHEAVWIEFFPEQKGAKMGDITVRHLAQFQRH